MADPTRSFDPRRVGHWECRAWVTYYRREWFRCLVAFVALVRVAFRMPVARTLRGAWLVLRANQHWAPYPDNDPAAAEGCMARFYDLVRRTSGGSLDVVTAARLEVAWWRAHREAQHGDASNRAETSDALVQALVDLYAFTYGATPEAVRPAAGLRAEAMVVSDQWVAAGCDLASPLVAEEEALLVRSYAALLAAVHR